MQELLATISASELNEWRAFDRIDPIGDSRQDFNTGVICQQIHGAFGNKTRPIDFMYLSEDRKTQKDRDADELSRKIASGFGVNVDR